VPNRARLVALSEVLADLTGKSHPTTLDDVQRLRAANLILFRGPQITAADAERLECIVLIRDSLQSKWTIPELAFFMILHGLDGAPAGLVGEYIEKQIQGFVSASERALSRLGTDRVGRKRNGAPIEAGMARLLARQIARSLMLPKGTPTTDLFSTFLENAATVLIGGAYLNKSVAELMPYLRRAVYFIADTSSADALVQYIASHLDDVVSVIRVDWATNRLLSDLRQIVRTNPDAVREAVKDSARILRVVFRMLGEVPDPNVPRITPSNQYMLGRLIGPLPAVLAAMSLRDCDDTRYRTFYSRLRSGDNFGLDPRKIGRFYAESVAQLRTLQKGIVPTDARPCEIQIPVR
jgi:hypothetical protein